MMHAKSESDVTSLAPSSPPRSPKRGAVYYVQSPSRDSHDGDKSSTMHATPVINSPMESPSHPSYGRHSRTSSASRFSGTFRSWSGRKGNKNGSGNNKRGDGGGGGNDRGWPECKVIQEEGPYDEFDDDKGFARRCQLLLAFLVFVLFFTTLCLIIWGATRPYKPDVVVKGLAVDDFYAGEGTDHTGVPTKMVTVNCSLTLSIYNPAPTFGIHVRSSSIDLVYSKIPIASGELAKHYIPKKSRRSISVLLQSEKLPLYGAGAGLTISDTTTGGSAIPLTLEFDVVTRGYVVGKLVRTTHRKHVFCKVSVTSAKNKPTKFMKSTCTYT